jgi:hypothetical protein
LGDLIVPVASLTALYRRYHDVAAILGAAVRLRGAHDRSDPQIRELSSRSRNALGDECLPLITRPDGS